MALRGKDSRFFSTVNKSALESSQAAAGAGLTGLIGFALLFLLATVFFVAEAYFAAMVTISVALLVYVTGADLTKLVMSSITIFFSTKHLTPKATQLQTTLVSLQSTLDLKRDLAGELKGGPIQQGSTVRFPDNRLARDIQVVLERQKGYDYAEYVAHSYFVDCHKIYDNANAHLGLVATAMPLFGLIGTIVGLIAMFDSLGGNVTIEAISPQLALALKTTLYGAVLSSIYRIIASRFEQRLTSLEYDFETLCRGLQVLVETKAPVEIQE